MATVETPLPPARTGRLALWAQSYRLEDLSSGRANNFNLLRFLAATLVILSHSTVIAWGPVTEPVYQYFGRLETGGSLGVLIFFAISGYLITQSFAQRGRGISFLTARALRIYPGLITATIFSVLLASLASSVPLRRFLFDPVTRGYLLHNAAGYPTEYFLPGAFAGNPIARVVNGSLWTLPVEMEMYVIVAVLGIFGMVRSRAWFNGVFAVLIFLLVTVKLGGLPLVYGNMPEVVRMAITFLCGAFFYVNRARIPIGVPWMLALLAAIAIFHRYSGIKTLYLPAVAYIALVLAFHPKLYFAAFNRLGDYSYGLYIYAYPTQQLVSYYNHGMRAIPLFLCAYPCILAMAVLSWKFLEKPVLQWKPKV